MAPEQVSTNTAEGNTPAEEKYHTRYGEEMTADNAAIDLLDRATERLNFLTHAFFHLHDDGRGFTLPGYMTQGLSYLLEDIKLDVAEVHDYIYGDNDAPGRDYAMPLSNRLAARGGEGASHE